MVQQAGNQPTGGDKPSSTNKPRGNGANGGNAQPSEAEVDPDVSPAHSRYVLQIGHIDLVIEPGRVRDWKEFCKNAPPYSMALDGYVRGLQEPDLESSAGPKVNFNHHEDVVRGATSATCRQVYEAIKDNLFDAFSPESGRRVSVYVNDCDHDVCLAVWLLSQFDKFTGTNSHPSIDKLVEYEDRIDRFAGAYPYKMQDPMMGKLAWIFEPYTNSRTDLQGMKAESMANIIESVHGRLTKYFEGDGQSIDPTAGFVNVADVFEDIPEAPTGWSYITEEEPFARTKLKADGKNAFISIVNATEDRVRCSIGKFGPYVQVNINGRYDVFNSAEDVKGAIEITAENCWGGSNTIGGTPRSTGSGLTLSEIFAINNRLNEIESGEGALTPKRIQLFVNDELPDLITPVDKQ